MLDMSISSARFLILLAVLVALLCEKHFMLGFSLVLLVCLEILAHTERPNSHKLASFTHLLSVVYLWAILLNRSRSFRLSEVYELLVNLVEHLAFALVICLILLRATQRMSNWTTRKQMLVVFLAFNLIGLGNEWFQNALAGRALFASDAEAIKDLCVNLCGSVVFLGLWTLDSVARSRPTSPASNG